jgi:hypothetical protein
MAARLRRLTLTLLLGCGLALGLAACGPEGDRDRGDGEGTGADIGNRGDSVEMHGDDPRDERIYRDTPNDLPEAAEAEE